MPVFIMERNRMNYREDPSLVNIGRITSAVGLRGELRVILYAEDSENLHVDSKLYLDNRGAESTATVKALRMQKGRPVIRLSGVDDRTAAEALRNTEIYIPEADLAELEDGEYYIRDLIGLAVFDQASGQTIGTVADILENTSQSVYVVKRQDGRELLIPAVPAFEREIDPARGVITVELIPGFLE